MRTEIVQGIQCMRCGDIQIPPYRHEHCKKCNAGIYWRCPDGTCIPSCYVRPVLVQVTRKLFYKVLEEVKANECKSRV